MANRPLPGVLDVGPLAYRISTDPDELARRCRTEGADLLGHTDEHSLVILIDGNAAVGMQRETLTHEALHAVTMLAGLHNEWGSEAAEKIVTRLSPLLLDLLRRNPMLVAYLTADDG